MLMVSNALLRERTERQTEEIVLAVLLLWNVEALELRLALCLRGILQTLELAIELEPNEAADALVLRKAIAEILEERVAALRIHLQANLCKLLQNILESVLLGDDTLRVEGVHVGHLELVRQSLRQDLLGHTLHANADLLIRREIREVLGSTIRNPLLQRFAEVRCPGPHRELRHDILVLLLAEEPAQATILADGSLEATHPRLKRCRLERRDISAEPLAQSILQHVGIARRHERRVARTNTTRTIHEKHRQNRSLELGLHGRAVIIAILENAEVVARDELLDLGLEIGVDVTGTRCVLATLETRAELSLRNEPRQIVAAHEVLRHADDRLVERRLTVVIASVLTDLARELRHTNLCRQVALERRLQDLALRCLESVHHRRNAAFQIVVGEVDEVLVHKLLVGELASCRNDCLGILRLEPVLAIVRARLVERQIDRGIALRALRELHLLQALKVFLGFLASRGTQSLVVLDLPALAGGLLPVLLLHDILERQDLLALRCLHDRSCHVGQEPRDGDELMPELVEEVDEETADVRAILVLIGHDHHRAIAEACEIHVLGTAHETQDLLEFGDLLGVLDASICRIFDVEELATKRLDSVLLALFLRQSGERHRLGGVSLRQDERALLALNGARLESIVELRDARDAALLLAVRLRIVLAVLCRLRLEDAVHDRELADDFLEKVLRERARRCAGENFLGLRGERRVLHEALDEDREMILDEAGLDLGLLFGFEVVDDRRRDLVDESVHVLAALRPDAVDERHREELVRGAGCNRHVPVLLGSVHHNRCLVGQLHGGVGLEIARRNERAVLLDLDLLADRHRQIPDTALDQLENGFRHLRPLEASQIRSPRDLDVGLVLAGGDLGLLHDAHVVAEGLDVLALTDSVHDRDRHLLREDVDELDAVAVLATDELLLGLVVVGGSQELAEDHLWDVDLVLRVLFDVDRLAVVADREDAILPVDLDELDGVLRLALAEADDLIVCVHEKFVDELVEPGADRTFERDERIALHDVHLLRMRVDAANVGIGEFENMFTVRELLVLIAEGRHCNPCCRVL